MSRLRIGQVLEQMGKLSPLDIDEILHEQSSGSGGAAKKTFGEIALTWGLCQPQHIWKAWANQLSDGFERVDLATVGVDTQAVSRMPRELAVRFCAMPLRDLGDEVVIAVADPAHVAVFEDLYEQLHARPRFVLAEAKQIREMIERYYPAAAPGTAAA